MPDPGAALTDLTGDVRLLAVVDVHLPYCSVDRCMECGQRLGLIRRSLTVLNAAGRLRPRPEETTDAAG